MKCKKCGNIEFRPAHRNTLEWWLSQVIPVRPYECAFCDHRQMGRIKPFFNASRMISASVFGLTLTFISIALIVSLKDGEPKVRADKHPTLAKQLGKPVPAEPNSSEPALEKIVKAELGKQQLSEPSSIAGNESSANMVPKSDHGIERDIWLDRSSATHPELENTAPPSVMSPAKNNWMSRAQVKPRSGHITIDDNKREAFPTPVPPPVNNWGTSSDRLDTLQIDSSGHTVSVKLQGTGPFDKFKLFELDKGERLVVDLPGQWTLASGIDTEMVVTTDWLYRIRLGEHARFFRLVFDIKQDQSATPKIETSNRSMTITLTPLRKG